MAKKKSTAKALLNDCAPQIWKKMTEEGQDLWVRLNATFYNELAWWKCIPDETKAIIAHNLACETLFMAERMGVVAAAPMMKPRRTSTRRRSK